MQFVVAIVKKLPWVTFGIFLLGLVIGLVWAYVLDPIDFVNATPSYLRADLQADYMRIAIDSYRVNPDPNLAVQRWQNLGTGAQAAYTAGHNDPQKTDPAGIR